MPREKKCIVCGSAFTVKAYRAESAKTCSPNCYHTSTRKPKKRTCSHCGAQYETSKAALRDVGGSKSPGKKYCSLACRDAARHKRQTKLCEVCGTPFEVRDYRKDTAHTCSTKCAGVRRSRMIASGKLKQSYRHSYRGMFKDKDGVEHGFDSAWELLRMHQLEGLGRKWKRDHGVVVPYVDEQGVERSYIPDFLVEDESGRVTVEEIKPNWRSELSKAQAKYEAAKTFCASRGWLFEVLGESDLGVRVDGSLEVPIGGALNVYDLLPNNTKKPRKTQKRSSVWQHAKDICMRYNDGETMEVLAKDLKTNAPLIRRILIEGGVDPRRRGGDFSKK